MPKVTAADAEAAARAYLKSAAAKYAYDGDEVDGLVAGDVQRLADGGSIARFGNRVDGIEVFRDQVNVLVDKSGGLVAISGVGERRRATPSEHSTARLTSVDAIGMALAEHGFAPRRRQACPRRQDRGRLRLVRPRRRRAPTQRRSPRRFARSAYGSARAPRSSRRGTSRCRSPKRQTALPRHRCVLVRRVRRRRRGVCSATTSSATSRSRTACMRRARRPSFRCPGPGGRGGYPHPTATADGYQPTFATPNLVTLDSAPFSQNDPWLSGAANRTAGNNVEAFSNMLPARRLRHARHRRMQCRAAGRRRPARVRDVAQHFRPYVQPRPPRPTRTARKSRRRSPICSTSSITCTTGSTTRASTRRRATRRTTTSAAAASATTTSSPKRRTTPAPTTRT